ncbi:MAG: hypothetical protein HC927_01715 [Deltaproteobacteria bacterium]|nr:hypothetical protein [Deltaproteobacteria bacterium]
MRVAIQRSDAIVLGFAGGEIVTELVELVGEGVLLLELRVLGHVPQVEGNGGTGLLDRIVETVEPVRRLLALVSIEVVLTTAGRDQGMLVRVAQLTRAEIDEELLVDGLAELFTIDGEVEGAAALMTNSVVGRSGGGHARSMPELLRGVVGLGGIGMPPTSSAEPPIGPSSVGGGTWSIGASQAPIALTSARRGSLCFFMDPWSRLAVAGLRAMVVPTSERRVLFARLAMSLMRISSGHEVQPGKILPLTASWARSLSVSI